MSFFTYFKKRNKTDGFTVLCVSVLFKFEISCLCESFLKFDANLVMFTTINIYDTILNKYYVHHILKICICTGMTATTKFVLCHTRQHLPPFSILRDRLGGFHQEKIVFWLPSIIPYMARRQNFSCRSCISVCVFKISVIVHNRFCVRCSLSYTADYTSTCPKSPVIFWLILQ